MPKFRVYKGHDAYVNYEAIIEADSIEDANERMSWKTNRNEVDWVFTGDVDEFDQSDFHEDMTEQLEEGEDETLVPVTNYALTAAQRDAVLAALRLWQQVDGQVSGDFPQDLMAIFTNSGAHEGLTLDEIDELCEAINV